MATREYLYTPPTVTNAVGGDPNTGTKWGAGFVSADAAKHNAVYAQIAGDINFIFSLLDITSADTLSFSWASNDAVIVHPGIAIADDGTTHSVANDTTLSLDSDLDTGSRAAGTIYFIWIGEDTISGDIKLLISESYDTPPTSLVSNSAYRLKNFFNTNSGNSNIEQFVAALPDNWPSGMMMPWNAPYKPAGCHWAKGQTVSRTHGAYAAIFALYGTEWGVGDGSTTFGLPDTQGRSLMGAGNGSGLSTRALADTPGEEDHTLSVAEMPSHSHTFESNSSGVTGATAPRCYYVVQGTKSTNTQGSGSPHNTVHPSVVTNFIIKG